MLTRLEIANVRNLQSVSLLPHPHLNLLTGPNGSGKTSVLEAVYLLAMGRSFRAGRLRRLINDAATSCTVFAEFADGGRAGLQRHSNGEADIRLDGRSQVTLAEMAQRLPLALLDPASFMVMQDGAKPRRALLDWGVFHVEHGFYPAWQRYQRALKQRNSLLRSGSIGRFEATPWERELAQAAVQLHACRSAYLARWTPCWQALSQRFLPGLSLTLDYSPGWETARDLEELLAAHWERDREKGHTQLGPHRTDLRVKHGTAAADEVLSRGQMKLALCALRLSQVQVLEAAGRSCVLLVDDLPSELDAEARQRLLAYLQASRAQIFLTAIAPAQLLQDLTGLAPAYKLFHVEHGAVTEG